MSEHLPSLDSLGPTVDVVTAGRMFGLSRAKTYQLAKAGDFPAKVISVGRQYRVVTADLRRVLGADDPAVCTTCRNQPPSGFTCNTCGAGGAM